MTSKNNLLSKTEEDRKVIRARIRFQMFHVKIRFAAYRADLLGGVSVRIGPRAERLGLFNRRQGYREILARGAFHTTQILRMLLVSEFKKSHRSAG
jgi:hypothetical protein